MKRGFLLAGSKHKRKQNEDEMKTNAKEPAPISSAAQAGSVQGSNNEELVSSDMTSGRMEKEDKKHNDDTVDPLMMIPREMVEHIFSFLDPQSIKSVACVELERNSGNTNKSSKLWFPKPSTIARCY